MKPSGPSPPSSADPSACPFDLLLRESDRRQGASTKLETSDEYTPRREEERLMCTDAIAAVARIPGGDFSMEAIQLDAPRPGEVLVRIAGVGLCHTDLVF